MESSIFWALLLTILPGTELRFGLPLIVLWSLEKGVSYWPFFFLVILVNILVIPIVFFFLEFFHHHLMEWRVYHRTIGRFVERKKKTAEKVEEKIYNLGYLALALFVAIPFTGTGAYTGTLIAWILGLSKKKSFVAISLGVLASGLITLFATLLTLGLFG